MPIGSSSIEAPIADEQNNNNEQSCKDVTENIAAKSKAKLQRYAARSPSIVSSISADSSIQRSTPHSSRSSSTCSRTASQSIVSSHTTASDTYISIADADNWSDDDDDDEVDEDSNDLPSVDTDELSSDEIDVEDEHNVAILTADCASGYLIPNRNFGHLLQPNEIQLAGNFVADQLNESSLEEATVSQSNTEFQTSQRLNCLRSSDYSEETEEQQTDLAEKCCRTSNSSSYTDECVTRESSGSQQPHHQHRHKKNSYYHKHYHHHHHHHHHQQQQYESGPQHHCIKGCKSRAKKRLAASDKTSSAASISSNEILKHKTSADVSPSSSLSDGDACKSAFREHGRMKFKNTANLLHRLFVCIAGVADQLQTNFASDLRQILRSVFLMNMPMLSEDLDIPEKSSESELFEFRASETDVIQQESGGSNQSIYSAEEVNAELDNVFNHNNNNNNNNNNRRNRHSAGPTVPHEANPSQDMSGLQMARSRSVGDEEQETVPTTSRRSSSYMNARSLSSSSALPSQQPYIERKNSLSSNSLPTSSSSNTSSPIVSETNSPVSERSSSNNNNNNNNNSTSHQSSELISRHMSPPAWIPDDKAPRCMSCCTPFTAFRRRHHCRNCGGVFCGVCSNASTPLPKYGLTKAVRVCRKCYMREILSSSSASSQQYSCTTSRTIHTSSNSSTTAGGL